MTVPPSDLPTVIELVSAGHLERISSRDIRTAILFYMQQVARAEDYIDATSNNTVLLSRKFPQYFTVRYSVEKFDDDNNPEYICDYEAMREDKVFLNFVNQNRDLYSDYTFTGVLPVGEKLRELHGAIDLELGITHDTDEGTQ